MHEETINYLKSYHSKYFHNSIVLDLGCSTTEFLISLLRAFPQIRNVIGIDDDRDGKIKEFFNVELNDFEKQYSNIVNLNTWINTNEIDTSRIEFFNIGIEKYLESINKVDVICLLNVLHFYSNIDERDKLLKSIVQNIKIKGILFCRVASDKHPYKDDDSKIVYTEKTLNSELEKYSLELQHKIQVDGSNIFGVWKLKPKFRVEIEILQ